MWRAADNDARDDVSAALFARLDRANDSMNVCGRNWRVGSESVTRRLSASDAPVAAAVQAGTESIFNIRLRRVLINRRFVP